MSRFRWWLARYIAPVPITAYPGKGAAIICVVEGAWITLTFTKARLRSTMAVIPQSYTDLRDYRPPKRRTTFVGIAED